MALSSLVVRQTYVADGLLQNFTIPFQIIAKDSDEVRVFTRDDSVTPVVATPMVEGTDYDLTGRATINDPNITVSFRTAPLAGLRVVVERQVQLTQNYDPSTNSVLDLAAMEQAHDRAMAILQQINLQVGRIPQYADTSENGKKTLPDPMGLTVIGYDALGNLVNWTPAELFATANPSATLQLPTDGEYGGPIGNPAKVAEGDLMEDAFDKICTLLSKMVPTPPDDLAGKLLTIPGSYTGLQAGTGASHLLIDSAAPVITPGLSATLANSFSDAEAGDLSAEIDGAEVGLVTLTPGDDSGLTGGQLQILADFDPYAGQGFGREGIFQAITARIQAAALALGLHTAQLKHTLTGDSQVLNFYVDAPLTPTVGGLSIAPAPGYTVSYKSGVPGVAQGQTLNVGFTVSDAVGTHYNVVRIAQVSSPQTNAVNRQPATPPAAGASFTDTAGLTVGANAYSENLVATVNGYNSKGGLGTGAISGQIRVDTVGAETRVRAGQGQYPATGYGTAFDPTASLAGAAGLQYLNGRYQYPPAVNYGTKIPAGPDYSALVPDTYNNNRWACFSLGNVNAVTSITFAFSGAQNFGGATLVSGLDIYVRVDGAQPTAGWINANAAYPGVGSPTNNGDGALDVGGSTATTKRVTFGSAVKTGTVYVRVGIPQGSNKAFGGIA